MQPFCGSVELFSGLARHRCAFTTCPLHNRIIPRDIELDIAAIAKLHDEVAKKPFSADVLKTITNSLVVTEKEGKNDWPPQAQQMEK